MTGRPRTTSDDDVEDDGPDLDGADDDHLAPVVATLPLHPTVPFEAPAVAEHEP